MTLHGYTTPRTPRGRAGLVPAPPWHYVGDFLVVDYWADGDAAASLLPEGLEPFDEPGRCAAVFVDWQSRSEGGDELTDPVRAQYKEAYVVVSALLDEAPVSYCAFIWVDQDFAMARGWVQGFPKKRGEVWLTRTFAIPSAAAPAGAAGDAFGATCSARGRELMRARVTLDRVSDSGSVHTDPPIVNVRYFPRLGAGDHDRHAPGEEHALLAPVSVARGYRFTFAYTVDDLVTVRELGA